MRMLNRLCSRGGNVQCLWRTPEAAQPYRTAVSLHSHTLHSREGLDFIPRVMRKVGILHKILRAIETRHERNTGRAVGYERAFWQPPLNPQSAYKLEADQIRQTLGLDP